MGAGTRLVSSTRNRILVLALQSEDKLPRLERSVLAPLEHAMARLASSPDYTACVVTGTERAFAVGADIEEIAELTAAEAREFSRAGQRVFRAIERARVPVIAAIQGYCMGGGLDLALACHRRIATHDAVFAHPGGALGILTGWGGTQRLTRLIGRGRTLEMLTTGQKVDAHQALGWGLIDKILDREELESASLGIAALR